MGTLSNRHIIDTVKGVKMFKDKYPEIPLIYSIIGDGEELYEIKNYIHMQKLESTIHTYGRLPYSELKPFLDTHNIGISYIPQLECYEYQPPTKTFEYALSGLYTIATNTYENRQVIHSNNGILINDTISDFAKALYDTYQHRREYNSQTIRKSMEKWQWEKIIQQSLQS